jgi:hypothetical protein
MAFIPIPYDGMIEDDITDSLTVSSDEINFDGINTNDVSSFVYDVFSYPASENQKYRFNFLPVWKTSINTNSMSLFSLSDTIGNTVEQRAAGSTTSVTLLIASKNAPKPLTLNSRQWINSVLQDSISFTLHAAPPYARWWIEIRTSDTGGGAGKGEVTVLAYSDAYSTLIHSDKYEIRVESLSEFTDYRYGFASNDILGLSADIDGSVNDLSIEGILAPTGANQGLLTGVY